MADRPTIEVTQEDLDNARPKDSSHCMIADAVKRALPHAKNISVDLATIRYSDPARGKRYIILTPPIAQQQLLWFDQADPRLEPFSFRLPGSAQTVAAAKAKREGRKVRGVPAKHGKAQLVMGQDSGVPEKRGGNVPPLGPLASTARGANKSATKSKLRTGRVRAYGLRSMARD